MKQIVIKLDSVNLVFLSQLLRMCEQERINLLQDHRCIDPIVPPEDMTIDIANDRITRSPGRFRHRTFNEAYHRVIPNDAML
ncbi:hypothetical protein D3C80_1890020 [compost metagenome]